MIFLMNPFRFADPFDPNSLANLELWMDASDGSTITLGGNSEVTQWDDKSDNGHIATAQSTNSLSPTVVNVGGTNMIDFNQSFSNHFSIPDDPTLDMGTGRFTLFCVYRKREVLRGSLFNKGDNTPRYETFVGADVSSKGQIGIAIADEADLVFAFDTVEDGSDDTKRGIAVTRDAGGDYPHWQLLAAGKDPFTLSPLEGTVVGDISGSEDFFIGSRSGGSPTPFYLNGDIGEILIYKTGLSDSEIDQVNDYLASKWSL